MVKKGFKVRLWRGITSILAVLLVAALAGTHTANVYAGSINNYLGTSTSEIVYPNGQASNTTYYKSEYGDFTPENLQKLIADTYAESVLEQEEGSVLLTNKNDALPLAAGSRVTLFGHAFAQPVYEPGGVNASGEGPYQITPDKAFESVGLVVNHMLLDAYIASPTTRVNSNSLQISDGPMSSGDFNAPPVLGEEPISFYTDALRSSWEDDYNDVAIVMFARQGGEDVEMMMVDPEGISALALHKDEADMLAMIRDSGKFEKTIVLLNSAFPMEVEWLDEYNVDACLWIGDPGLRGFEGVANILTGRANPSGRLVDTYAASSISSPAAHVTSQNVTTWSNLDEVLNGGIVTDGVRNVSYVIVQSQGIYIGYKYYETRYEDAILNPASGASSSAGSSFAGGWEYAREVSFPFGYGLSYTTFEQTLDSVTYDADSDSFIIKVTVTNTGNVPGRSVAEIYAQTPYGDYEKQNLVEKSAIMLAGFEKTGELAPNASETLEITVDRYFLASYDYTNAKGYILSAGDYYFSLGDDAHDALNNVLAAKGATGLIDPNGNPVSGNAAKTYHWTVDALDTDSYRYSITGVEVTNQFDDANLNYWHENAVTYLTRQNWKDTFPETPVEVEATEEMMRVLQGELYEKPADAPSVRDFNEGVNSGLSFAAMSEVDYDDDETWNRYLDQMTIDELVSQVGDVFGLPEVPSVGKPAYSEGDGTASIFSMNYPEEYGDTREVCLYPGTVVVASTWSRERLIRRGELLAEEAMFCKLPLFFTGGANLHRTPFGGRNGEYYSEDPILTNLECEVSLDATYKKGVSAGVKHFAGNDQELRRDGMVVFIDEQTYRETAVRGFEGVLTNNHTSSLMESVTRIGLTWSSASYALTTQVLRNEWGFKGMIETDAIVGVAYKLHFPTTISAGATNYCLDFMKHSTSLASTIRDNDDGYLLSCLRNAVKNNHYTLTRSALMNGLDPNAVVKSVTPWWVTAIRAFDTLIALLLVGSAVLYFLAWKKERAALKNTNH